MSKHYSFKCPFCGGQDLMVAVHGIEHRAVTEVTEVNVQSASESKCASLEAEYNVEEFVESDKPVTFYCRNCQCNEGTWTSVEAILEAGAFHAE